VFLSRPPASFTRRWHDTGARIKTTFGGVGHILNVTSQQWLDTSRAATARDPANGGPTDIWTHQVGGHYLMGHWTAEVVDGGCRPP
jgi:hypothetical protein